ncbi:hypothetical protein O7635_00870 [Asanoa sp. WMMD1127]|uniref:hypothetical protein n=1 Tax=Asanoa sp. WMMD1127 TaxID=3016107 RepID=UPI002415FE14|nr:hypothetical protein [Asanoa sp. WMMD1127]MDG4820403.1 hypothetical protein [Asanoa sp. WMMD1127]
MPSRNPPLLLRRWRRALRTPASHTDGPGNAQPVRPAPHLDSAVTEVHAARVAMRNALLALDQALDDGERMDASFRRVIHAEISGTREEAALLTARLATTRERSPAVR